MRLLSWNVNGIRAIYKKGFLDWIQKETIDILCLQEIKAQPDQIPPQLRNLPYYHVRINPGERKGYSGVATFMKTKPMHTKMGFDIARFDSEGRILISEFSDFTLFNIYFPNGKKNEERLQYKLDFYNAFLDVADTLREDGNNIVVCGDFNTAHKEIDLARPKSNEKRSGFLPIERAWIDTFIDHGYVDTFRMFHDEADQYSWWDMKTRARERNIGWRIDYFFVNKEFTLNIKDAFILPDVMGSDHCPVGLDIDL